MAPRYAANTDVSSEKSRLEIERTLKRYGASAFMYGTSSDSAVIAFDLNGRRIKFVLPLPDPRDRQFTHYRHSSGNLIARTKAAQESQYEQAIRQRWRALALVIKAKLEAVQAGIVTFDEEFLAHLVIPGSGGQTVGDRMLPQLESAYRDGDLPPLLPHYKN